MKRAEAIEILRKHNIWRRYDGPIGEGPEMTNPTELGEAIDLIVSTELTWEDCKTIVNIADSMLIPDTHDCIENWGSEQEYYEEILKRFNEKRK